MIKIIVDSIEEKERLIKESEYIHDYVEIVKCRNKKGKKIKKVIGPDTDFFNTLAHIYCIDDIFIVNDNSEDEIINKLSDLKEIHKESPDIK